MNKLTKDKSQLTVHREVQAESPRAGALVETLMVTQLCESNNGGQLGIFDGAR